ncbi:MAG: hypothetical protein KA369_03735 [Spirochaetes bacterium]|nr:hypothetical protein [Spirochaetota bacterium]
MKGNDDLICPFCEEGTLKKITCKKCGKPFLICDECESIYKDTGSLDEDGWAECPYCGTHVE